MNSRADQPEDCMSDREPRNARSTWENASTTEALSRELEILMVVPNCPG